MNIVQESFKRIHYPVEIILLCLRWYLSYSLSLRNLEEMMLERNINVDHSTIHKWMIRLAPLFEKKVRKHKPRYFGSWHVDETYIKVKGKHKFLYRAVTKYGKTIDFMLSHRRNRKSAILFFQKAMFNNVIPNKVYIDKSGANFAAVSDFNTDDYAPITIIQSKYMNNIVEQDHRFIKKRCKAMLGFKTFKTAGIILGGIESIHMLHKNQIKFQDRNFNPVDTFYKLVG